MPWFYSPLLSQSNLFFFLFCFFFSPNPLVLQSSVKLMRVRPVLGDAVEPHRSQAHPLQGHQQSQEPEERERPLTAAAMSSSGYGARSYGSWPSQPEKQRAGLSQQIRGLFRTRLLAATGAVSISMKKKKKAFQKCKWSKQFFFSVQRWHCISKQQLKRGV